MNTCFKLMAAVVVASLAVISIGCSEQSEGQPCSRNAGNGGNDDCKSGLTCQQVGTLQLCCPPPGEAPSVPECVQGANMPATDGGAAEAAAETGPGDAAPDTAEDAASDVSAE